MYKERTKKTMEDWNSENHAMKLEFQKTRKATTNAGRLAWLSLSTPRALRETRGVGWGEDEEEGEEEQEEQQAQGERLASNANHRGLGKHQNLWLSVKPVPNRVR